MEIKLSCIKLQTQYLLLLVVFLLRFYLFIHDRHREREAETKREEQTPCREPAVGLDPGSLGSHPVLKAALNRWATGATLSYL